MSEQVVQDSTYRVQNAKVIEDFIEDLPVMTEKRIEKHRTILTHVSNWWLSKPFDTVTRKELKDLVRKLNAKEDFKESTKCDYRKFVKKFFKWLQNAEFVEGIRVGNAETTVGPEDILTEDELSCLYESCRQLRDKALSGFAYETAARPHETLGMRKCDVVFDDIGAVVYVRKGKTGARRIRVIDSSPLLSNWIANHPREERDAPLWVDMSSNTKYTAAGSGRGGSSACPKCGAPIAQDSVFCPSCGANLRQ
jgi:integrase/recombinase XerD